MVYTSESKDKWMVSEQLTQPLGLNDKHISFAWWVKPWRQWNPTKENLKFALFIFSFKVWISKRLTWSQFLFALLALSCKCNAGLLCLFLIRGWRANVSSILMLPAHRLLPHPQATFFLMEIFLLWVRCFSSIQFRCLVLSDSLRPHGLQHTRLPCPSIINSQSLLRLMSIELVMPSNHLLLCRLLLHPPSILPSIRVFSNESVFCIRWPKYWSFSFSISPSNEYSRLISFRMDWLARCLVTC